MRERRASPLQLGLIGGASHHRGGPLSSAIEEGQASWLSATPVDTMLDQGESRTISKEASTGHPKRMVCTCIVHKQQPPSPKINRGQSLMEFVLHWLMVKQSRTDPCATSLARTLPAQGCRDRTTSRRATNQARSPQLTATVGRITNAFVHERWRGFPRCRPTFCWRRAQGGRHFRAECRPFCALSDGSQSGVLRSFRSGQERQSSRHFVRDHAAKPLTARVHLHRDPDPRIFDPSRSAFFRVGLRRFTTLAPVPRRHEGEIAMTTWKLCNNGRGDTPFHWHR